MPDGATPADPPASPTGLTGSAAEQRRHRLAKVEALRARGIDPYPVTYPRDRTLAQVRDEFGALEAGAETQDVVHVAGRVMLKRDHGGLVFMSLKDESGFLQIMASRARDGRRGVRRRRGHRHRRLDGLRGPGRGQPPGRAVGARAHLASCSARRSVPCRRRPAR